MDWIQVFTIIISLGGIFYWFITRLEKDIGRVESSVKSVDDDLKTSNINNNARMDQLYRMFIEVQKENHQKFYDMLKSKK